MSWFSKKQACAHCGTKKTKKEFEGSPTCPDCQLNILMTRETARSCPLDGNTLVKSISGQIILDLCPVCKGVWLDAGELDAIKKAASEEGLGTGMVLGLAT